MDDDTEIGLLIEIRDELRQLGAEMARVDERSLNTDKELSRLRDGKLKPLEKTVERNHQRSVRNAMILSAIVTTSTIALTWALGLIPL